MKLQTLFLPKDLVSAGKELDCYGYCLNQSIEHFLNADFKRAAAYHENIARSLKELQRMHEDKRVDDQARYILSQIEARQHQEGLHNRLSSFL